MRHLRPFHTAISPVCGSEEKKQFEFLSQALFFFFILHKTGWMPLGRHSPKSTGYSCSHTLTFRCFIFGPLVWNGLFETYWIITLPSSKNQVLTLKCNGSPCEELVNLHNVTVKAYFCLLFFKFVIWFSSAASEPLIWFQIPSTDIGINQIFYET